MSALKHMPRAVSGVDVAFGGQAMDILPKYSEIPEEFKSQHNPWVKWQQQWFYNGLKGWPKAKDGIDAATAIRNLKCCQGSWEPKHEHKEAGVAYLASLWFESPETGKIEVPE